MRILGIVFSILLWLLFGWKAINDSSTCCNNQSTAAPFTSPPIAVKDACPICFIYNGEKPKICDNWSKIRDQVIASCDGDDNIIIEIKTGKDEKPNISKLRATQMKALFDGLFEKERIIIRSEQHTWKESALESCMAITSIRKSSVNSINENIVEIDSKIVIYFPENSTQRINNRKVESYLNQVAGELRRNNKKVKLVGHTDNVDDPEYNLELGQRRADIIRTYLVSKGISATRIVALSKGETMPISSNESAEGRAKNRRTELEIID